MCKRIEVMYRGKRYASLGAMARDIDIDISYISRMYHKHHGNLNNIEFRKNGVKKKQVRKHYYYYVVNGNELYSSLKELRKKYKYPKLFMSRIIKTCPRKKRNKIWYYDLTDITKYKRKSLIRVGNVMANKEILDILDDGKSCLVKCLNCNRVYIINKYALYSENRIHSNTCIKCSIAKAHELIIDGVAYKSYNAVDKAFNLSKCTTSLYYRRHKGDMSNFANRYIKKKVKSVKVKKVKLVRVKKVKPVEKVKSVKAAKITEQQFISLELEKNKSKKHCRSLDWIRKKYAKLYLCG